MKPEQDKASVGDISRQRWNLRVLTFFKNNILNNGLNQSSVIWWGKERHAPVEVKLHLRFHSCQWWGSCSHPTPNGDYYHCWFCDSGRQERLWKSNRGTWVMFSPLTAQSSSSPTSIKSAAEQLWRLKNPPFPSENRTSHTYFIPPFQSFHIFTISLEDFLLSHNLQSRIRIVLTSPSDLPWKQLPLTECAKKSWESVQNLASKLARKQAWRAQQFLESFDTHAHCTDWHKL